MAAAYIIDMGKSQAGIFLPWNDSGKDLIAVNASETGWSVGRTTMKSRKQLLDFMFFDRFSSIPGAQSSTFQNNNRQHSQPEGNAMKKTPTQSLQISSSAMYRTLLVQKQ